MWLCSICSQIFGRGSERLCTTKCGHVYHSDCILEWLETANSCPDCREYCSSEEVIMIYLNSNVISPERIDEVKRLNGIQDKALEIINKLQTTIKDKMQDFKTQNEVRICDGTMKDKMPDYDMETEVKYLDTAVKDKRQDFDTVNEALKMCKDVYQQISKLQDIIFTIEDVTSSLSDVNVRAREILERYSDIKESGHCLKTLAEFSARLQRDIDCYANNYRKIQSEAYENSLANVILRSEKYSLECDLTIVNEKVEYLNTCIELLKKDIIEKHKTIKDEVEAKRKIVSEYNDLSDKNKELYIKLETAEAGVMPVMNTIKRLNMTVNEKTELETLHTRRIEELNYTIDEMDKKIQTQNIESIAKCEEKDAIIREQKRRLSIYAMQCDELTDKLKGLERKIYFYEAVIRGVVDRKGEPESPRFMHLGIIRGELEETREAESPNIRNEKSEKS